jgi:hypothetical protein
MDFKTISKNLDSGGYASQVAHVGHEYSTFCMLVIDHSGARLCLAPSVFGFHQLTRWGQDDFVADMRLIFKNAFTYNTEGDDVWKAAKTMVRLAYVLSEPSSLFVNVSVLKCMSMRSFR